MVRYTLQQALLTEFSTENENQRMVLDALLHQATTRSSLYRLFIHSHRSSHPY